MAALVAGHNADFETGHLAAACPANWISRIAPRPLFLLNRLADERYVRETAVAPLHRLARSPNKIVWAPGGHIATPDSLPVLGRWLTTVVK